LNQTRPTPPKRTLIQSVAVPPKVTLSAKMRIAVQHLLGNAPEGVASAQEQLAKSRHLLRPVKRN